MVYGNIDLLTYSIYILCISMTDLILPFDYSGLEKTQFLYFSISYFLKQMVIFHVGYILIKSSLRIFSLNLYSTDLLKVKQRINHLLITTSRYKL